MRGKIPPHRSFARLSAALCTATLLVGSSPAAAASGLPAASGQRLVEIVPPSCKEGAFPLIPFLDSLRVELAGRGLACCTVVDPEAASIEPETLRVNVDFSLCAQDASIVRIGVAASGTASPVEREISLADVAPPARARALALAAAELIRSFGQTPAQESPKEAPLVSEKPPAPVTPAEPQMASRLSLHAEGQVRVLPTRSTALWGGRMRLTLPWRMLYAQLDLGGDATSAKTELGTVSLKSVSMGVGAGPRFASRALILDLGPRFELGWAWIRGETSATDVRAGRGGGVVASLGLRAALEIPAANRLRPGLAFEAGGVLRGTRGESDGHTVVGITGYYLIGTVAIAFSL